jgi:hypothetical protein
MSEVEPVQRVCRSAGRAVGTVLLSVASLPAAAILLSVASIPVAAQTRAPAPPSARAADQTFEAARAAFESLSETERRNLQDALVWTGDQVGGTDGAFGRQTFEGLMAYQRRLGIAPTGLLDPKARAALLAEGQRLRQAAGFTLVDDSLTGVRIGIPTRLLPKRGTNPGGGSRWQSADERITVDTRSVPAGEATLQSLYERNLANQGPGRKVTYKVLRPDFFVVSGETPGGRFYTRYGAGPEGLKGLSIGYDKSLGKDVDRLVIAMANSFSPFGAVATAASPQPRPAVEGKPPAPAGPMLLGTGLATGQRRIATTAKLQACTGLRVRGRPARVAERGADGLVLLEPAEPVDAPPLSMRAPPADSDVDVLVLSYASGETPTLVVAPGELRGGTLSAPVQPPAGGGVVLDRDGAVVGLVTTDDRVRHAVAGTVPVSRYAVLPGDRLAGDGAAPAGASDPSAAALVAAARTGIVPITCEP